MADTDINEDELKRLERRLKELHDETTRLNTQLEKLQAESDRLEKARIDAIASKRLLDTETE